MPPPSVAREVAEIAAEPDRAAAYACLFHLQRGCADDPSAAADLAAELPSPLLPLLLRDAADPDEAVADSALKCLGFALYHPILVPTISAQMAQVILDTLVQLIMNTRMKSVCNLGMWCISVQQLEPLIIEDRADQMVTAIVHALDNPFGSLSTTFEATQFCLLETSNEGYHEDCLSKSQKMRDLSSLWVPPIYRRLLSADKPERDMAERCLIKVSRIILPPQPLLSKAVALDLEQKLLSCMMNMLNDPSKKVQAVKSWGWMISLLGPDAVNNRPLLNKLLKVPEQMFIDLDTQVQIATMVSWRNLVDAFFPSQATESVGQQTVIAPLEPREHASAQVKRTKLIMVPLCRVLSRSHNIVLSSSCLTAWNYLLHKLGNLINHLPILEAAFGPVLKIIFSFGISDQNKPLWSFCMNLFHDFSSSKSRQREDLCTSGNQNLVTESCMHLKALLDVQHIKWLPWDLGSFHFQLDILGTILNPELLQDMVPDKMLIVMNSATEIFRFLLGGVQIELKDKRSYEQVRLCITDVCKFVKKLFLDHVGKHSGNKCAMLLKFGLQSVEVIVGELDHSLLNSEKIEVCLDIEHIKENQSVECSPKVSFPGIRPLSYMEMVSPAVYMTALSLSMVGQYTGELSHGDAEKLALILSSSDILNSLHVVVSYMYMQIMCPIFNRQRLKWLMVWTKFARQLNDKVIFHLKASSTSSSYDVFHQFFCYPLFSFLYPGSLSILLNAENGSCAPVTQDLEVEFAIDVYRSLYTGSCNSKAASKVFFEGFYDYLVNIIDEHMTLFQANLEHCPEKFENAAFVSALGEVVIGLLQNDQILAYANQELNEIDEDFTGCQQPNLSMSCLNLVNRFMRFSRFGFKANPAGQHQVTSRFFSSLSNFVGRAMLKKDILLLFKIIGDQLTEWLSLSTTLYLEMQQGKIMNQLEKLWLKILECLNMNQLISDAPFSQNQRLLQVALNHPHHAISVATKSACRAEANTNISLRSGRLGSELDGLSLDRRKDHNSSSGADKTIAREEIGVSSRPALPMSKKRTKHAVSDTRSLKISAGVGRKQLKIMKYSTKPKELNKNTARIGGLSSRIDSVFSPRCVESKECRKPELILEMLKRKR